MEAKAKNFLVRKKKNNSLTLRIADITILIRFPCALEKVSIAGAYNKFISSSAKSDVVIHAHYLKIPRITFPDKYLIFGVKKWWGIYRLNGKNIFVFELLKYKKGDFSVAFKGRINYGKNNFKFELKERFNFESIKSQLPQPRRVAIFKPNFSEGHIYTNSRLLAPRLSNPLSYPFLQLVFPHIVSLKQGSVFHACGVIDVDQGYLFLGRPGQGKTTMAKLWQEEAIVLHDDHIPTRKIGGSFFAFPLPCFKMNLDKFFLERGKLSRIFFLRHSSQNEIIRQNTAQAASMLFEHCFNFIDSADGAINFCADLAKSIPCYSLGFLPNKRIVDFIRRIKE